MFLLAFPSYLPSTGSTPKNRQWTTILDHRSWKRKKKVTSTHLSQAVKAVPPCNLVSQLFGIGMTWNKDDFI
jgi:hypothetical protein